MNAGSACIVPLTHVVTGASGYTGRYIARRLLDLGHEVRSLTGHPYRQSPFGDRVAMLPYNFDDPDALARSLEGVDTLFNTYWIRLSYKDMTHERVVGQLRTLFGAAKAAGVRRVVHISITNATLGLPPALLQWEGAGRGGAPCLWSVLRHAQADSHLRQRGHPAQ